MQNMSGSQLRESLRFFPTKRRVVLRGAPGARMRACGAGSRAGSREIVHHAEGGYPGPGGNRRRVASDRAAAPFDFDGRFLRGVVGLRRASAERFPQDQRRAYGGRRMPDGTVVGDWTTLPSEAFVLGWRESGGPGKDSYSFDAPKNSVYVFFNASDDRRIIELDYTVVNGRRRIPT